MNWKVLRYYLGVFLEGLGENYQKPLDHEVDGTIDSELNASGLSFHNVVRKLHLWKVRCRYGNEPADWIFREDQGWPFMSSQYR